MRGGGKARTEGTRREEAVARRHTSEAEATLMPRALAVAARGVYISASVDGALLQAAVAASARAHIVKIGPQGGALV